MRKSGFTLIEILIVVGIIILLIGALVIGYQRTVVIDARRKATKAMQQKLIMALQSYYNEFRQYPPDGYDSPVYAPNGIQLKGSACLVYYLGWIYPDGSGGFKEEKPSKPDTTDPAGQPVAVNGGVPYLRELSRKEDLNRHGEILDGFGNPTAYDNCESGYTPGPGTSQNGKMPDPRESLNGGRPFNSDSYDLWSGGPDGASAQDDIFPGRR